MGGVEMVRTEEVVGGAAGVCGLRGRGAAYGGAERRANFFGRRLGGGGVLIWAVGEEGAGCFGDGSGSA